jgi:dipeptidyl aminopeptidase/acylaminoacyl peptidase
MRSEIPLVKPAVVLCALLCASVCFGQNSKLRPLSPDDMFRMEGVGETTLSPDGQWLAYVRRRPVLQETFTGFAELLKNDHADVWVQAVAGGPAKNITNGVVDGSGFWAPQWSPDGQRIAMLSTRGGNLRLWMWSKATGQLELLSERAIDLISVDSFWDSYLWISDTEIVAGTMAPGRKPHALDDKEVPEKIRIEWAKAWEGREPTSSVLESGVRPAIESRPQGNVLLINVVTKKETPIASGLSFGQFALSPDKRRLAFLKQVDVWQPNPEKMVTMINSAIYGLFIADLQPPYRTQALRDLSGALQGSLLWSPDSSEIAFIGYTKDSEADQALFRYRVTDGTVRLVTSEMKDLGSLTQNRFAKPPMIWWGNRELLLFGRLGDSKRKSNEPADARWWAFDGQEHRRDLFMGQSVLPTQILREGDGGGLVGLIDGQLRRISHDGRILESITRGFNEKLTAIVWSDRSLPATNFRKRLLLIADAVDNQLIVRTDPQATDNLFQVNLKSGEIKPVRKPFATATLVAWNATTETRVFLTADRTGTYLTASSGMAKSFLPMLETNTFLREISEPELKKIHYRALDGQELTGWVMLPHDYEPGKRYPLVAWVYPGTVYTPRPPRLWRWVDAPDPYNMQFLAGRGYAVLFPSMPIKPHGEKRDTYMELTKGVLPAVEKVVDLGIADPDHIGLMGSSFGGYATYGMVTQTNRFRAAVAICGISNLVSQWGVFGTLDSRSKYDDYAHEDPFRMWNVETIDMGGPPWKEFGRYLRNSPITYVDRVQTPVLIIHGDLDYDVPLEQSEEYFTALYRQNKRARFVRYWGEGHTLMSPANVRDMWKQIVAWFDEFLSPEVTTHTRQQSSAP